MIRQLSLSVIAAFGVAACGGTQDTATPTPPPETAPATDTTAPPPTATTPAVAKKKKHTMCPLTAGMTIAVADVDGGATVTMTGTADQVAFLRKRAQKMAKMHAKHKGMHGKHAAKKGMHGKHKGMHAKHKGMHGKHAAKKGMHAKHKGMHAKHKGMHAKHKGMHAKMRMPAATLTVTDVPDGVQIVFKADDPAKTDALRAHLRKHTAMMRDGSCKKHMHNKHKKHDKQPATTPSKAGAHDHGSKP